MVLSYCRENKKRQFVFRFLFWYNTKYGKRKNSNIQYIVKVVISKIFKLKLNKISFSQYVINLKYLIKGMFKIDKKLL